MGAATAGLRRLASSALSRPCARPALRPPSTSPSSVVRRVSSVAAGAAQAQTPLSGPGRDEEPARIYRYAVDSHGQLFLHDTPVKNIATCYKDPAFLDFFFVRVKRNAAPAASDSEMRVLPLDIQEADAADVPAWDAQDWPERLVLLAGASKAEQELLAARIAQRAGYRYYSPCMGELNFIRPLESDGTAVVYRDLVAQPAKGSGQAAAPQFALLWAGRRLERFDPAQLTLNPETGRMYHPSPRPLARADLPVCALSDSLVLRHMADSLEILADDAKHGAVVAQLHWHGQTHPIRAYVPSRTA